MNHLDLFSGIGGFALAVEAVWPEVIHTFCDIDPFSQVVLKKHWPQSKIYGDIKELKGEEIGTVDIVTGGFPCQPFSAAGKRRGKEDDRHLWPEMLRVIRETSPRWVVGENVGGLLAWNGGMVLDEVYADLEAEGYEVWAFVIPACAVGAPHRRDRVWIIANTRRKHGERGSNEGKLGEPIEERNAFKSKRSDEGDGAGITTDTESKRFEREFIPVRSRGSCEKETDSYGNGNASDSHSKRSQKQRTKLKTDRDRQSHENPPYSSSQRRERTRTGGKGQSRLTGGERCYEGGDWAKDWPEVATRLCTLDDGLPDGSPRPKGWRNAALKGAGNAIVPQVAEMIMRHIKVIE